MHDEGCVEVYVYMCIHNTIHWLLGGGLWSSLTMFGTDGSIFFIVFDTRRHSCSSPMCMCQGESWMASSPNQGLLEGGHIPPVLLILTH